MNEVGSAVKMAIGLFLMSVFILIIIMMFSTAQDSINSLKAEMTALSEISSTPTMTTLSQETNTGAKNDFNPAKFIYYVAGTILFLGVTGYFGLRFFNDRIGQREYPRMANNTNSSSQERPNVADALEDILNEQTNTNSNPPLRKVISLEKSSHPVVLGETQSRVIRNSKVNQSAKEEKKDVTTQVNRVIR